MTYAYFVNGVIESVGALPRAARRLDNGKWVLALNTYADRETREACGWFEVVETDPPTPGPSEVLESTVGLVDGTGTPTRIWTVRPKTADELAADTARANDVTIRQQAETALTDNQAFLAIGSPSQAQVLAQVRALTRQSNGLIRLVLGKLDATN